MHGRAWAVAALLAAWAISGCGTPGWTLMVENGNGELRIVRIYDGDQIEDRAVGGSATEWVVVSRTSPTGPISILDPVSCQVLATLEEVPKYHTIMVIDPDDQIYFGEDGPGTTPHPEDLAPTFDGCPAAAP